MWKEYGIRISKKGKIFFDDICIKILKSSSYSTLKLYISDDHKYYINNKLYVTETAAILLILKSISKLAIKFSAQYLFNKIDKAFDKFIVSKQKYYKN